MQQPSSDDVDESDVQVTRELLARHTCTAVFCGLEAGREPMLRIFPPQPAKQWARFDIEEYEEYEKPGKYGDEQQTSFAFVPVECEDAAVVATVAALQPADRVRVSWRHEYVTRSAWSARLQQRTSSAFPERPVVRLERLPAGDAS
jgi:hypothetical protein